MEPQKVDVEDALSQMRAQQAAMIEALLKNDKANPDFVHMQERLFPVREAFFRFALNEMNVGASGSDIVLAVAQEMATCLGVLTNDCVGVDVLTDPPPNLDVSQYKRYQPSLQHAMLHILIDTIGTIMHDRLYEALTDGVGEGEMKERDGGYSARIMPKDLKVN